MSGKSPEEILKRAEEAYRKGEISEETYRSLLAKYSESTSVKSAGAGVPVKTVLALVLIAVVAGGIAYYLYTSGKGEPIPTSTPSPSPPETSKPPKTGKPPKPPKPSPTTPPPSTSPPPSSPPQSTPPETQPPSQPTIFDFQAASYFKYKITTTGAGQSTTQYVTYRITSGSWAGQECWVMEITMESDLGTFQYKVWNSKATGECLHAIMIINGKEMEVPCSQASQPGVTGGEAPGITYNYEGKETVTVPAGTFTCDKWTATVAGATMTYWVAPGVPVPVKWESHAGGVVTVAELVEYS